MNVLASSIDVSNAIAAMLAVILTMVAFLAGTIRWLWRQAQTGQKQADAVNLNTEATQELSKTFKVYVEKADGSLLDHEKRITRLEDQQNLREGPRY